MENTIKVIPSRCWINLDGRTASLYGAKPHGNGWSVQTRGYTWEVIDHRGSMTVGLCRIPATSIAEAEAIAQRVASVRNATVLPHNLT